MTLTPGNSDARVVASKFASFVPTSHAELANEADDSAGACVARVIGIPGVCLDDDDVDDVPGNVPLTS